MVRMIIKNMILFMVSASIFVLTSHAKEFPPKGYYWRDFDGKIPADALAMGKDDQGGKIYMGHAYSSGHGVVLGQIKKGKTSIVTFWNGAPPASDYVQILCGAKDDHYWAPLVSSQLETFVENFHAVLGGFEETVKNQYVGGITDDRGVTRIGKIHGVTSKLYAYNPSANRKIEKYTSFNVLVRKGVQNPL